MTLCGWIKDCWVMMLRTKPKYLSTLGRKRSSIQSPLKGLSDDEKGCSSNMKSVVCFAVMCCSLSYGLLLLLLQDEILLTASNLWLPLVVAGVASISGGLSISEYMSSHTQEVPSIYSCCYQYSSEIFAFFIGWCSLISQAAVTASICKVAATLINQWTKNYFERVFVDFQLIQNDSLPSIMFAMLIVVLVITGIGETMAWFVLLVPIKFILVAATVVVHRAVSKDWYSYGVVDIKNIDQALTLSALCLLFFSGPQSILRISHSDVRQKTTTVLGPLNVICFIVVLGTLSMVLKLEHWVDLQTISNPSTDLACKVILLVCLVVLGIESFHPLHFVIEDMASDGLLFRTFSKRWRPFCFSVAAGTVQVTSAVIVGCLTVFLSLKTLLFVSVTFPLLVNTLVPLMVLLQRYLDYASWQYEPMFHTAAKALRDRSRSKSEEYQYTNGVGYDHIESMDTTCIDEESSEENSDTDIDTVFQQYKDQAKIANMGVLEEHDPSKEVPEPTPASSFHAKLCIGALLLTAIFNSVSLNSADMEQGFIFVALSLGCTFFATVLQGLLLCLPQNKVPPSFCCPKWPRMPWIPGMACLINMCLLFNCLIFVWEICLGWCILGTLIYFGYGIRCSTAATSFYNLRQTHIALCPLPSYGKQCIPQVIPSQRRKSKLKHVVSNSRRKPVLS